MLLTAPEDQGAAFEVARALMFPKDRSEAKPAGQPGKEGAAAKKEKSEDELRTEAQTAWRKKFDAANAELSQAQTLVSDIQSQLNDTTGGVPLLVDWVNAMLTGGPGWTNVEATDEGLLLPGDPRPPTIPTPPFFQVGSDVKVICGASPSGAFVGGPDTN